MSNKTLKQFSHDEILRQQLELLAERSRNASNEELPALTHVMIELHKVLPLEKFVPETSKGKIRNSIPSNDFS